MPGQINIPLQHPTCWYWQNNNSACSAPPVHPHFPSLETYNIRCPSYCPSDFQLFFPKVPPRMLKNSRKNYALDMNERKILPTMWIWIWLGPEVLPNSEIIQGESWVCFWQSLSSALKSFVMGQRGQDLKREEGGIKHLSESIKDILIKLVEISVQDSFPFPYDNRWRWAKVL